MKSIITIIFTLFVAIKVAGQNRADYFNYNGKNLNDFLSERIKYPRSLFLTCKMPFVYVRFKIKNNMVNSLSISNNNYEDLNKELSKELVSTNGHWNTKNIGNKWIVLPVMFHITYDTPPKGCNIHQEIDNEFESFSKEISVANSNYLYFPPVIITAIAGVDKY